MASGECGSMHPTRSRLTNLAAIGVFAVLTIATSGRESGAQAPKADTGVRQTVARINHEFAAFARARNAGAAAAWFAPDAILYANGMPALRGRGAIQQFYAGFFQSMPIRDMTFTTEEIIERGDIAIETGEIPSRSALQASPRRRVSRENISRSGNASRTASGSSGVTRRAATRCRRADRINCGNSRAGKTTETGVAGLPG
jgi:ketosteroid isomerase-like protein